VARNVLCCLACLLFTVALGLAQDRGSTRLEVVPVPGGADLVTLFFTDTDSVEIPLISVLRDTLGRPDPEVHRLRYVWVHTLASPSLKQRFAAAVPFMYNRFGNAGTAGNRIPSPALDLATEDDRLWKSLWRFALKGALFEPKVALLDSAWRSYEINRSAYLLAQLARASTALDMDDTDSHDDRFPEQERLELQRRLAQRSKGPAQLLSETQLERLYVQDMVAMRQSCARNWELLRQRAESEGLYFEPLLLPDGTATHAILWVAREDVDKKRPYSGRFLSIASPWDDKRLQYWTGATETREFGSRTVELIPLALYGLDHPKIPILLIDFRKPLNAKRREVSRQAFEHVGSMFGGFLVRVGKTAASVAAHRKGRDFLQPSRAASYSQLKLVLSVNATLSDKTRDEIARRAERVATNPLENDFETEVELARNQYTSLVRYARSGGLRGDLDLDRRAELTSSMHGGLAKVLFRAGRIASFGAYQHREPASPLVGELLEEQRKGRREESFLHEALKSGAAIDIQWDMGKVRNAMAYLASSGFMPRSEVATLASRLLEHSRDPELRLLCLETLQVVHAAND
jgi:hypothetical protein